MTDERVPSTAELESVRRVLDQRARAVAARTGPERLFALVDGQGVVLTIMVTHDPSDIEDASAPSAEDVAAHHAWLHDKAESAIEVTDLEVHRGMRTPDNGVTWLDERHLHLPRIHGRRR